MSTPDIAVVILAAGHGTRMRSALPKVLHPIGGLSMLGHVMACAEALAPKRRVVVIGDQAPVVGEAARAINPAIDVAIQAPPRGTGDAVIQAMPALDGFDGVVLVLYADTPLITPETLRRLIGQIEAGASVSVLGFRPAAPGAYGRLIVDDTGDLSAIVEANDASAEQLAVTLVNSGVMAIASDFLRRALPQLTPDNAKKEYYLTDIVAIAARAGARATALETDDEDEVRGVNARGELAAAETIFQQRRRAAMMENGITLIDPSSTYFSHDTVIASDVTIEPHVFFAPGVQVETGVTIRAFSHLEGAHIGAGSTVGPYARLRPGARLHEKTHIGNFVEIKKSDIGAGSKVNHLSYIGDASVGAGVNVGAGTITCNYDGFAKHQTVISDGAFIGSNSALVAPVTIGAGAFVGSGAVITKDVAPDSLAVARARQTDIPGWAGKFRARHHMTDQKKSGDKT